VTYRAQPTTRRFKLPVVLLALLALLLLTAASLSALLYLSKQSPVSATYTHPTATTTSVIPVQSPITSPHKQPTSIIPTHTPKAKPTTTIQSGAAPTSQPTPVPTPTTPPPPPPSPTLAPPSPTPTPIPYPNVAGNYSGTVDNTTANIVTGMSLLIQQKPNSSKISGYFNVNPPLVGDGNFSGSVTTAKHIQFLVQSYKGNAPLYFWGTVQSDGSLQGNYCSVNAQNKCDPNAGASGTWDVAPTATPLTIPGVLVS